MQFFPHILKEHENWLMERVLFYAKKQNYTRYTSTLKEAWRISIQGLSESIEKAFEIYKEVPELNPDEDFTKDPIASFGILEAHKHRKRGIVFGMFLGLFKYYKESYFDLAKEKIEDKEEKEKILLFLNRIFDRIEIGFCVTWASLSEEQKQEDLQKQNRDIINEKNKFLTIIESLSTPIILLEENNQVEYINLAACKLFSVSQIPGAYYYRQKEMEIILPLWLKNIIKKFLKQEECCFESIDIQKENDRYFIVQINKMLNISQKFRGIVVILYDITLQEKTRQQNEKLQNKIRERSRRLEYTLKTLREKEKTQRVLLKEVNHRVKNNLAALIGMLHMEQDRAEAIHAKEYQNLLEGLASRIRGLSTVHTMLSEKEWKSLNLGDLSREVVQGALSGEPFRKKVLLKIEPCELEINGQQAHHITLVLNELATNTIKYALCQKEIACIEIDIKKMGKNIVLVFKDDGPGYPETILKNDFSCAHVGFELIQGIVTQSLGGNVQFLNNNGAVAIIEFPQENQENTEGTRNV